MNLDLHIRDIWIAVGVLAALGLLWAFFRTTSWQYRSGIEVVELRVRRNPFFCPTKRIETNSFLFFSIEHWKSFALCLSRVSSNFLYRYGRCFDVVVNFLQSKFNFDRK